MAKRPSEGKLGGHGGVSAPMRHGLLIERMTDASHPPKSGTKCTKIAPPSLDETDPLGLE
jgi:hypothetical protein